MVGHIFKKKLWFVRENVQLELKSSSAIGRMKKFYICVCRMWCNLWTRPIYIICSVDLAAHLRIAIIRSSYLVRLGEVVFPRKCSYFMRSTNSCVVWCSGFVRGFCAECSDSVSRQVLCSVVFWASCGWQWPDLTRDPVPRPPMALLRAIWLAFPPNYKTLCLAP